ncbi:hypothetical protein Q1695_000896 [Nippostrongylus brasiliensis]|nr:hypothetical protein Q1695_000896 [Nippostrongylus brasiliensis]
MQEDDTVSERNKISIDLLSEQKTQRMSSSTIIVFPCIIDLDNRLRRVSDVLFPHDLPRYNNLAMHYRSQAIDLVPIWQHEDTRVPARMLSYSMGSVETCRRERPGSTKTRGFRRECYRTRWGASRRAVESARSCNLASTKFPNFPKHSTM